MVAADDNDHDDNINDDDNNKMNNENGALPCKRSNMQQEDAAVQVRANRYIPKRDIWVEFGEFIEGDELLVTKLTRCSGFV